jgi:hypothetical protein
VLLIHQPGARVPLAVPLSCAADAWQSPFGSELSRVVSRTGPQSAWLSRMREVSKPFGAVASREGSNPSPPLLEKPHEIAVSRTYV